jgi:hypothetical protein
MKILDLEGRDMLGQLTEKYYKEFESSGMFIGVEKNGIHNFWYYVENKFKFKIIWNTYSSRQLAFENDTDYLAFILKEM